MNRLASLTTATLVVAAVIGQLPAYAQSGTRDSEGAAVPNTGGTTPSTSTTPGAVNPNEATPGVITPRPRAPNAMNANPDRCGLNHKMSNGAPCTTPDNRLAPPEKIER